MLSLQQIIDNSKSISDITEIPDEYFTYLMQIGLNAEKRKGIYTVLVTLLYYKYLNPKQDVRRHQAQLDGGFSGRSFDTQYVTPVLKQKGLPSMAESGWLTRSLEQPYPYDFNYNGKLPKELKTPFLKSLDYVEKAPSKALSMLRILLNAAIHIAKTNKIAITPLKHPEKLTINKIIRALNDHFFYNYHTHHGAKLPVLAFHAIYTILTEEMKRYEGCSLAPLSSLTACDATNKASGDIEIKKSNKIYETIEIKLSKEIDAQTIRIVKEKIYKWNPTRYYVLSVKGIKEEDKNEISSIVKEVNNNHGCQIIINGLIQTIKYYLRLISNPEHFIFLYSNAIENDSELQPIHKKKWNEIISKYGF